MLSRGNSEASARLRRAKSSASIGTRQYALIEPAHVDPLMAKEYALVAASHAFGRATSTLTDPYVGGSSTLQTKQCNNGLKLHHHKSVRFTGPAAIPIRKISITRREAKEHEYESQSKQASLEQGSQYDCSSINGEYSFATESPQHNEYVETRVASLPSSYRKLRRSKSMLGIRGSPLPSRPPQNSKTKDDGTMQTRSRFQRSFSFLRSHPKHSPDKVESQATTRVEATQLAREQYLRRLEQHRKDEQLSSAAVGQSKKSHKAFRKTVRTSSANSYDSASALQTFDSIVNMDGIALGKRARILSSSLKGRLRRAFQRSSERVLTVPPQQLDSTRAHFGRNFWANTDRENALLSMEISTDGTSADHEPLQSSEAQMLDRQGPVPPSLERRHVDGEANDSHSRVTSWTDSTAANTITLDRLSNGRHLLVKENEGFAQRLIFRDGTTNITAIPNGSDRRLRNSSLYAMLQDKINNKQIPFHMSVHKSDAETQSAPVQSALEYDRPTSRAQLGELPSSISCPHTESKKASGLWSTAENQASTTISPHFLVNVNDDRTMTIPRRTEMNKLIPKKPLREVRSIFFPSSTRIERHHTSPFRRAMQTGGHKERFPEIVRVSGETSMSSKKSKASSSLGAASPRSLTCSDSIYSRTSSGNTPKPAGSSPSLPNLDCHGVLNTTDQFMGGKAEHCQPTNQPARCSSSAARRGFDRSNQIGEPVIQSRAYARASSSDVFSSSTRTLGHKKENPQINDEVTNLRKLPNPKTCKRPLAGEATETSFLLRKVTSQPMRDRLPLKDIEIQPNVPKVESQMLLFSRPAKSLVEKNSIEGSSSNQECTSPEECDLRPTYLSLVYQTPKSFASNAPGANENGGSGTPLGLRWKSQKPTTPPMNLHSRSSPERIARLRQIYSGSASSFPSPSSVSQQNQRMPENRKAGNAVRKEFATDPENISGHGGVASGGQRLVESFLSTRGGGNSGGGSKPETKEAAFI